jgi:hypothetical protein
MVGFFQPLARLFQQTNPLSKQQEAAAAASCWEELYQLTICISLAWLATLLTTAESL